MRSEIVEYLHKKVLFLRSEQNGGNFLTICYIYSFQSLVS